MTIKEKAEKVRWVLIEAYDSSEGANECNVTDILADIRHFCDRYDVDFHRSMDFAYDHYCAEKREEE
jgi:hypothetical protein